MNSVILSTRYPVYSQKLRELGYDIIPTETVESIISYEQNHADMQCLIIDDTAFVLSCCHRLMETLSAHYRVIACGHHVRPGYPDNVALNALILGTRLIGRLDAIDDAVIEYAKRNGYQLINVRQGYTRCSCAVVSDNALITADNGIYHSLKEYKIDVLKIEEGRVALPGTSYGFIGGASGPDIRSEKKILYFSGNITGHPDYERIRAFCHTYDTDIVSLSDTELTDIGGMIFC